MKKLRYAIQKKYKKLLLLLLLLMLSIESAQKLSRSDIFRKAWKPARWRVRSVERRITSRRKSSVVKTMVRPYRLAIRRMCVCTKPNLVTYRAPDITLHHTKLYCANLVFLLTDEQVFDAELLSRLTNSLKHDLRLWYARTDLQPAACVIVLTPT